jgi:DNA primase
MDSVSEIKNKLNIVDVINAYVPLKKSGNSYKGVCPFHKEKSPSFIVSEDIQHYRCFGCGKSGDIFNFIMEYEGLEFKEALNVLAEKAGVEIKAFSGESEKKNRDENERLLKINQTATALYHNLLTNHPLGKNGLIYLKKRGISKEIIEEFNLGYAPNSWDSLSKILVKEKFSSQEIDKSGLARFRKNNKDTYDLFRARLMVPLVDHLGRVVGFAGRALLKEQNPKYINSPETPLYHKEKFLFGLYNAKKFISEKDYAIIVEGNFDMISLYQHGYKNVVASSGTALTVAQINLIKRYTSNLYFLFDADEAGVKASLRGAEIAEPLGVNISVVVLGNNVKDPDELMQKDPYAFEDCLSKAMPLWDYYFYYASRNYNFDNIFERKAASEFLLSIINKITDGVIKSRYIKKFADLFEVKEDFVLSALSKASDLPETQYRKPEKDTRSEGTIEQSVAFPKIEFHLIKLFINAKGKNIKLVKQALSSEYFGVNTVSDLLESKEAGAIVKQLMETCQESTKNIDIKAFYDTLSTYDKNLAEMFEKAYLVDTSTFFDTDDALLNEFETTLNRIKMSFHRKSIMALSHEAKKLEAANEFQKLAECQKEINVHAERIREIEVEVNN